MNNAPSTSSAGTDRKEIIKAALEASEQAALKEAGDKELKVKEVKNLQLKKIHEIIGAKGSDGAAAGGENMSVQNDVVEDIEQKVEEKHKERMENIAAAPDAYVLKDEGTTVGVQHDDTREIGIAARGLKDDSVALHEAEHAKQDEGAQVVTLPPTGDPAIDETRELSRLALREKAAIEAEGGLKNHTPEYHDYVEHGDNVASYLNQAGQNGDALVDEAALTNEGFNKLHEAMVIASIKNKLQEEMPEAELVLAP